MSYTTWHNYGYGICVDDISEPPLERLLQLIHCAPECEASINAWLTEYGVEKPCYDDYMEYDQDYQLGLAYILYEVIEETEKIVFNPCDDCDGKIYLIYPPSYPWYLPKNETELTEAKIAEILSKYVAILTDEAIMISYYSLENGG